MSVCGQTEEESVSEEGGGAPVREMYEQKAVSTVVRVLTVLAYLLSVSLAAILLSVYYVCVWQSPKLPPLNDTGEGQLSALRADPHHYHAATAAAAAAAAGHNHTHHNATRGGNFTMSEALSTPPVEPSSLPASNEPPDPPPSSYMDPYNNTLPDFYSNDTWFLSNGTNATDHR